MAQKGNLITLRKKNNIELITQNTKIWASLFVLVENIGRLFHIKGVWILKSCCCFDTNLVSINFSLYYQTFKIAFFKKKLARMGSLKEEEQFKEIYSPIFLKNRCLSTLFNSYKQTLGYNYFNFNFLNLNQSVKPRKLVFLFKTLKMFSFNIFTRRYNLFIDFLKITTLFLDSHISLSSYIKIWVLIFKNLHKRLHGKFFLFVRKAIEAMLKTKKSKRKNTVDSFFCGAKFVLSGRIRGKPRSSSMLICLGRVPTQSIKKKVDFASSHVYTLYGVYGIKMWTFFENK